MSQVLITDTKLTNIADSIRSANGSNNAYTLAQMPDAITALPSYTLIYSTTLEPNNITSTANQTFQVLNTGHSELYTKNALLYVRIRDTTQSGRAGYFYGTDCWLPNYRPGQNSTATVSGASTSVYRCNSDGTITSASSSYGLFLYSLTSTGDVTIRSRYNDTFSLTIDGTYSCNIYLLKWPNNINPWPAN